MSTAPEQNRDAAGDARSQIPLRLMAIAVPSAVIAVLAGLLAGASVWSAAPASPTAGLMSVCAGLLTAFFTGLKAYKELNRLVG